MLEEEGDAALFSAAEVRPLLRLARTANAYRDALHRTADAIKEGRGAEHLVVAEDCGRACDEALSAFDFTD